MSPYSILNPINLNKRMKITSGSYAKNCGAKLTTRIALRSIRFKWAIYLTFQARVTQNWKKKVRSIGDKRLMPSN